MMMTEGTTAGTDPQRYIGRALFAVSIEGAGWDGPNKYDFRTAHTVVMVEIERADPSTDREYWTAAQQVGIEQARQRYPPREGYQFWTAQPLEVTADMVLGMLVSGVWKRPVNIDDGG